jgi:hypothetical protein
MTAESAKPPASRRTFLAGTGAAAAGTAAPPCSAGHWPVPPGRRGRSARQAMPFSANRFRHLGTTPMATAC